MRNYRELRPAFNAFEKTLESFFKTITPGELNCLTRNKLRNLLSPQAATNAPALEPVRQRAGAEQVKNFSFFFTFVGRSSLLDIQFSLDRIAGAGDQFVLDLFIELDENSRQTGNSDQKIRDILRMFLGGAHSGGIDAIQLQGRDTRIGRNPAERREHRTPESCRRTAVEYPAPRCRDNR